MRNSRYVADRFKRLLTALLSILLVSTSVPVINASVAAQGSTSVRGTVLDPQGKAVGGATVTLTSVDTNATRTAKSNDAGAYTFDLIPPGTYRIEAEAKGFKKGVVTDVRALVD